MKKKIDRSHGLFTRPGWAKFVCSALFAAFLCFTVNALPPSVRNGVMVLTAVRAGDVERVKGLFAKGVTLDPVASGRAFTYAFRANNVEMVKLLLANGVDPQQGLTAALRQNNVEMVKLMLANGAKPGGMSLLRIIADNNVEMVKLMLAQGADPNDGLRMAVNWKKVEIVKLMLAKGAEPSSFQIKFAAENGCEEIKQLLIKRQKDAEIQRKIKQRDAEIQRIINAGMPKDYREQGRYALALIAKRETKKFEAFIKDDNCQVENYLGLFMTAAEYGAVDIAKFLLELIDLKRTNFRVVYYRVILKGDEAFLKLLLERKIPFDRGDNAWDKELVLCAAIGGSVEIMKCVGAHGLDLDQQIHIGEPIHYGGLEIKLSSPFSENVSDSTALCIAAEKGNLPLVKYLVEQCGANVNRVVRPYNQRYFDALMCAAGRGRTDVCVYLISKGANPNFLSNGENAVLVAKRAGFKQCMEALIKAGGVTSKFELKKLAKQQSEKQAEAENAARNAERMQRQKQIQANYRKASREAKMAWDVMDKWLPTTVEDVRIEGAAGYYTGLVNLSSSISARKFTMRIIGGQAVVTLYTDNGEPLSMTKDGPVK